MNASPPPAADRLPSRSEFLESVRRGLLIGAAVACVFTPSARGTRHPTSVLPQSQALLAPTPQAPLPPRAADFHGEAASAEARQVADWIADSRDNRGLEFVIVDKRDARVFVFDGNARLRGASPVLLGFAPGDDTVPGIGSRPIADVRPEERTTPAGRFVGQVGYNARNENVVWVDYDAAVSMHRVLTTKPAEHRLERLATPTPADNRISYGCINVPVAFFEQFVLPTFVNKRALVYVLPEVKSVQAVFGRYDLAGRLGRGPAG